ncbi:hypothetical protein [Alkalitalea saponilacus]|uniref:Uncharacterized protein n=2 Tax=Alkalitalea saponilacus TaxID=889453 RepID=A0A1T5EYW9_9BACT|nr:hypothetical protein [Alkalitalea saponilacus]SKB89081.1 hypothetical protein SAMN03080601_01465 [Alkalitalea saponilacus]
MINKKPTSLVFIGIIIISCIIFMGCEKDEYTTQTEILSQSEDFVDYLNALADFVEEIQNDSHNKHVIGQINGENIYKTSKSINAEIFYKIFEARSKFVSIHPEYAKMNIIDKNIMVDKAVMNSDRLIKSFNINTSFNVRLKSGQVENTSSNGNFLYEWFSNFEDAFNACRNYSQANNNVESGGYLFPNGRAILIIDKNATDTTMVMPVSKNGMPSGTITYHFHDQNKYPSPTDSITMQFMKSYGVDSLIIVTPNGIHGYGGF